MSSDTVEWRHSRRSTQNIFPICSDPDISNGRCARGIQARWFPWVRMPYDPGFYIFKGARGGVSAVTAASYTEVDCFNIFISCIRHDKQPYPEHGSQMCPMFEKSASKKTFLHPRKIGKFLVYFESRFGCTLARIADDSGISAD